MTPGAISRSKGVHSVSDKDADAKNYKKCRNSFEHGRSKRLCSSKQLRWLHSQNDSPVAPTFSACLVILSNGLDHRLHRSIGSPDDRLYLVKPSIISGSAFHRRRAAPVQTLPSRLSIQDAFLEPPQTAVHRLLRR